MSYLSPLGILLIVAILSAIGVFGKTKDPQAIDRVARFLTSLKWTVILLALGLVLVFWGTLAQVNLGLYRAQNEFFRSFFVFWHPTPGVRIPVFPAGYMVGGLLLINLLAAHTRYYQPGKRKIGIVMIHLGVVLLLLGQLLTDFLSTESTMHLRNGDTKNYSEADRSYELAITDTTDTNSDRVFAIPDHALPNRGEINAPGLPFTVRVRRYYGNSQLTQTAGQPGFEAVTGTSGVGPGIWWRELPHQTVMDRRDMPSGLVELVAPQGSIGTFLVSTFLDRPERFTFEGRSYELALRPQRFYKAFSLHLVEFKHDRYPGTDIPKNFSSRVRLQRPATGEDREVLIYMNNPLRYAGETFYQASFDPDDKGSVLQVVHNPSWLTPYFSCVLVGAGLMVQFLSHLFGYATKRRAA